MPYSGWASARGRAPDGKLRARQAVRLRPESDPSGLARLRADDDEAEAVVGAVLPRLKRLVAGGVAVVHGDDLARPGNLEPDAVLRARDDEPAPVGDGDGDERQVLAVGTDARAVGLQRQAGRGAGRPHDVLGPLPAALVRHRAQLARLVADVVPAQ